MQTQIVNARIDSQLKREVDGILAQIGLTGPEAIRLFYAQVRNHRGIPFRLTAEETPNEETRRAIQNAQDYLAGKKVPGMKSFESLDAFMEELKTEDDE